MPIPEDDVHLPVVSDISHTNITRMTRSPNLKTNSAVCAVPGVLRYHGISFPIERKGKTMTSA